MDYPPIVFMVFLCVVSGSLGALWDCGAVRNKSFREAANYFSLLTLFVAGFYWLMLNQDIGQFWWHRLQGSHDFPKLYEVQAISLKGIYLQLLPAMALNAASVPCLVFLAYWLVKRRITKRQQRKAAMEMSSNE